MHGEAAASVSLDNYIIWRILIRRKVLRDNSPFSTISGTCRSKKSSGAEEESRAAVAARESRMAAVSGQRSSSDR